MKRYLDKILDKPIKKYSETKKLKNVLILNKENKNAKIMNRIYIENAANDSNIIIQPKT